MPRQMESKIVELDGPVHYIEAPGPDQGPTLVLVHGLGGSHSNWVGVIESLSRVGRVLAVDLAGFGRTAPAGRSASVVANRVLLDRFIEAVAGEPVVLVGNSMGGLISAMQASMRPETVSGLVLVNPALPRTAGQMGDRTVASFFAASLVPRFGRSFLHARMRSIGAERLVEETLRLCMADPATIRPDILEAQIAMARERIEMPWATTAFLEAARSIVRVLARRRRVLEMLSQISAPTLLIMGAHDRLVPLAVATAVAKARPDWDHVIFDDLGHTPMMEDPKAFVGAVDAWLHGPASWVLRGRQGLFGRAISVDPDEQFG